MTGTATDAAGNSATATARVSIDLTPPAITLSAPATGPTVFTPSVALSGLISDLGSGLGSASCNGAPAAIRGGAFSCVVSLTPGVNTVQASVTDRAGNSSSATLDISYTRVPIITINSPSNLSYTNISPTTITGIVDDPAATVSVNSVQAVVANGAYHQQWTAV